MTVRGDLLAFEILSIPPDSIEIERGISICMAFHQLPSGGPYTSPTPSRCCSIFYLPVSNIYIHFLGLIRHHGLSF